MTDDADRLDVTGEAPGAAPPIESELEPGDPRTSLQHRVRTVLLGMPGFFEFSNHIAGVNATDLFSLNTLLGASIEGQVVKALNQQRQLWDPDNQWLGYTFERQSQAFPDVRLVRKGVAERPEIALGIELKGWFLLSKEGVPSFRFQQTPAACAPHDLLCVVPWYLDNVLSGSPVAAEPFVESARWAAEYRNYYWQHARRAKEGANRGIVVPKHAEPYPSKIDEILDRAIDDQGKNFGRVARSPGLMLGFVEASNNLEVLGIRIRDWYTFLRQHSDQADADAVSDKLEALLGRQQDGQSHGRAEQVARLLEALVEAYR